MSILHRKRTTFLAVLTAAMFSLCSASLSAASLEAVVVTDADIKPYRDAIRGFKSACGCAVTELSLSEGDVREAIDEARAGAVVAVGTKAYRSVRTIRGVPVISLMAMPSETIAPASDNVSVVSMNIAPQANLTAMTGLFPGVKRIGVLSDPEHTGSYVAEASAVARSMGIDLIVKTVSDRRQAPALMRELRGRIDVFWMLPDPTVVNSETLDSLMLFSFQNDIPVFSFAKKQVERGAVAALTIDPFDMGVQAGELARSLSRDGTGPVRAYARSHRLVVNAKVAAKMQARINRDMIRNAEKVE